jgi:MFS family permease
MSPITPTIITALAPPRLRGSYQGIHQMSWGASSCLAPILGSIVLERLGAAWLWTGCLAVGVIAAIGFLSLHGAAARRTTRP